MTDYVTVEQLDALRAALVGRVDETADLVRAQLSTIRTPSKAHLIGTGFGGSGSVRVSEPSFLQAIFMARNTDAETQSTGKALLEGLGSFYVEADPAVKATLGTTDATGGWVMPNAMVDEITKAAGYANPYRSLVTVRPGVRTATVDLPWRSSRPARAVIQTIGEAKENVDLVYNGYTATMYTLARIHDLSNRFIRYSAGAAENDVQEELGTAIGLGERYYMISGAGTTEPYGLLTALTNAPATYTSSFTPSDTTLAGSIGRAIGTAAGALMGRGRYEGLTAIVSGENIAEMLSQGTDTAGFFFNGISGDRVIDGIPVRTLVSPQGIPVIPDDQLTTDQLVVGQWKALKLYVGADMRIDVSSQAGTRWDANLTGFRGEEDMAFDARPAVYAGAFQQVTNLRA